MAPSNPPASSNQLPPRENAIFKRIVKCYEHKQYKSGLRYAKQILSNPKLAQHGETLAMKGLILNCLGKKTEAYEYVRQGLKNDVKSHVCWHVYGLLQRADKKYDDAIKAYRNALKIDKENMQILRDLSLLQLQMRDLEGYKETRYHLFELRPTQRASWIGYAMAHHLYEDYDTAIKILEEFRKTQNPKAFDYEHSELLLYQNMVYREAEKYQDALVHMETYGSQILDKVSLMETSGFLLKKVGKFNDAAELFKQLIDRNPDNVAYYRDLEECVQPPLEGDMDRRMELYEELSRRCPRATAPVRIPLTFVVGPKFYELVSAFVKKMLKKGIPPLFSILRACYTDQNKVIILQNLMLSYADSLESTSRFPGEDEDEPPTTVLWVYYYLALHYDYLSQYDKALFYINRAIAHTPTLIELYTAKAKVYKHAGNMFEAVHWIDEAQSLDTADRYINSKCAKYMIRAGMLPEAEAMCSKFTRENVSVQDNLNEMQCMWFQTECARAYRQRCQLGEALKKCHEVDRHFTDIMEDQFDFHIYCVRRMTLCAYVRLLRLEDLLRRHQFYFRAAKCAIKIYLRLYDKPYDENAALDGMSNANAMTGEMRKQLRKQKKQAAKEEQRQKQQAAQQHPQHHHKSKQDHDPEEPQREPLDPVTLLKTDKPLEEATRFLKPLVTLNSEEIDAYLLGFEVYYRREKVLLMLLCLKRAAALQPSSPKLHVCKVKFSLYVKQNPVEGVICDIVNSECVALYEPVSLDDSMALNERYLAENRKSLPHIVAAAQALFIIDPNAHERAFKLATDLSDTLENRTWKTCRRVTKYLIDGYFGSVNEETIQNYKHSCSLLFPNASVFASGHTPVGGNMINRDRPAVAEAEE